MSHVLSLLVAALALYRPQLAVILTGFAYLFYFRFPDIHFVLPSAGPSETVVIRAVQLSTGATAIGLPAPLPLRADTSTEHLG